MNMNVKIENEDKLRVGDMYRFYMEDKKDKKKSYIDYEVNLKDKKK